MSNLWKPWTLQEEEFLKQGMRDGLTVAEIAAKLGRSNRAVILKWEKLNPISQKDKLKELQENLVQYAPKRCGYGQRIIYEPLGMFVRVTSSQDNPYYEHVVNVLWENGMEVRGSREDGLQLSELNDCKVCVLVLPADDQALFEAGCFVGQGKAVYAYMPGVQERKPFLDLLDGIYTRMDDLLVSLNRRTCKHCVLWKLSNGIGDATCWAYPDGIPERLLNGGEHTEVQSDQHGDLLFTDYPPPRLIEYSDDPDAGA